MSDIVWTPERGLTETPEVRGISWNNFLLSDESYAGRWRTSAEVRITPDTALQSTVFLACCRILAETVATLPIHIYRRLPDGGKEIASDIPLYKVLSFAPNSWQTKYEFFEQLVMTLCCWGNSYTQINSGRYGSVSELINLHPSRMDVERLENGRLRYSYTNPETGRLERYTQDQIMHVRWTPEPDGIKGMVPVEVAREAIALARACEIHAAKFWANSARPGIVLQTDGSLSAEAAERLRDNWERLHRGVDKAYKTAILTNGLKAESIGFTAEQSQFESTRRFQSEEIARVFRLPMSLIQGQQSGNLETSGREFVTYTLMPWLKRIESSISRSLIYNDDVFFAEFDARALMRGDSNSRASYYSTMTGLGIFSINDCRRLENMPPLEHGDKHFVAMNMQTLEDAVKPKPDPTAAMMGGPPAPAQGGVPSLPEVKKGEAPREAEKGQVSEKKPEALKEGDLVTWGEGKVGEVQHVMTSGTLDLKSGEKVEVEPGAPVALVHDASGAEHAVAVAKLKKESRAFCPTGDGGGVDNSCGSKESAPERDRRIRDEVKSLPESISAISAKELGLANYSQFVSIGDSKNSDNLQIKSDDELRDALKGMTGPKGSQVPQSELVGAHRDLKDGHPVDLRIDINAFDNFGTYAVTVHEHAGGKGVGKPIGFDSIVRLAGDVRFSSDEKVATQIAMGKGKTPIATVKGKFEANRDVPGDIDSWIPVGFNPKKAAYFYDKRTGQEVTGGVDAVSVGNSVFVRVATYGKRKAQKHYRNASFWGLESRADDCGRADGGKFGPKNTCAADDGGATGDSKPPEKLTPDSIPKVSFSKTDDAETFLAARNESTRPENFSDIDPERLARADKFMSEDGKAGCLVDEDGDLGNVFNNGGTKGAGMAAVLTAIESGAQTLDCYDGFLPARYAQVGFVATAKIKWNDEYAPPNWDYTTRGRPDVIIMSYQGGPRETIRQRVGSFSMYEPLPDDRYADDFDAAKRTARLSSHPQQRSADVLRQDDREGGGGSGVLETRSPEGSGRVHREPVGELIAETLSQSGSLPKIEVRDIGKAIAFYSSEGDTIYVSPDADRLDDNGWVSQPNPVLHELAHRHHLLADAISYLAPRSFTAEERSLIESGVSRYAATNSKEFVAEVLSGYWAGREFAPEIVALVASVTNGKVTL